MVERRYSRGSQSAQVYASIRRLIIAGDLLPGTEFTEAQLAEDLGAGRTPTREALARLRYRKLVTLVPPGRWAVAPIAMGDVLELFGVRRLLEGETTRLAATRASATDLIELDDYCTAAYSPDDPATVSLFLQRNTEFHLSMAAASGSHRLSELLAPILDEMNRLLHFGLRVANRSEEIVHEHRRLIQAISDQDPTAAVEELLTQLNESEAMVMRAFQRPIPELQLSVASGVRAQ